MSNARCKFLRLFVCTLIRVLMRSTSSAYPKPLRFSRLPFVITLGSVGQTDCLFSISVQARTLTHKPFSVIVTGIIFRCKAAGAWPQLPQPLIPPSLLMGGAAFSQPPLCLVRSRVTFVIIGPI